MSGFHSTSPLRAVAFAEDAGILDARRILSDFAAAGLLKSYALVVETLEVGGHRSTVRGGAVSAQLWQRIVHEGATEDVWAGGTVRLKRSDLGGDEPEVRITGISFNEKHLQRLISQAGAELAIKASKPPAAPNPAPAAKAEPPRSPTSTGVDAIPAGAMSVTVNQAMDALGLGRTKINELMGNGGLERVKVGARTLITVESIRKLLSSGSGQ